MGVNGTRPNSRKLLTYASSRRTFMGVDANINGGQVALREVIRRHGLNQAAIAKAIEVQPETLSRWANGHIRPSGDNLIRLLSHLRKYEPKLQAADLMARRSA